MKIKFIGAAREVTGSKHLITTDTGKKILLDCGMFQGKGLETDSMNRNLMFDPAKIDHVILTHAHIDPYALFSEELPRRVRAAGWQWLETEPFVTRSSDPVARTLEEALAITPRPVDDPALDAVRGLRVYRRVCERLETDRLWFRTPDFQGTLNTAGLVLDQQELLIAMHTEPELVHAFLDRVCAFLIDYGRYLVRETGGKVCGNIWPYTFLPADLGLSFTEDLMPLLSVELYQEFGLPYVARLRDAFGGVHIHCCGDWGRHAPSFPAAGLAPRAVEFHDPFTTIDELAPLAENTVFATYLIADRQDRYRDAFDYYRRLLAETPYRYWFPLTGESAEV